MRLPLYPRESVGDEFSNLGSNPNSIMGNYEAFVKLFYFAGSTTPFVPASPEAVSGAGPGLGSGAASPGVTVPTALTAPSTPWSEVWPTGGAWKEASRAVSGGCARVRGRGERWRGRRPGRGTVGPGSGGARSGSVEGGSGEPSPPPSPIPSSGKVVRSRVGF